MGWTKSGSIKGPKGDTGASSGTPKQGAAAFALDSSAAAKEMLADSKWYLFGKFSIFVNSAGEISFFPATGYIESVLCVFTRL